MFIHAVSLGFLGFYWRAILYIWLSYVQDCGLCPSCREKTSVCVCVCFFKCNFCVGSWNSKNKITKQKPQQKVFCLKPWNHFTDAKMQILMNKNLMLFLFQKAWKGWKWHGRAPNERGSFNDFSVDVIFLSLSGPNSSKMPGVEVNKASVHCPERCWTKYEDRAFLGSEGTPKHSWNATKN